MDMLHISRRRLHNPGSGFAAALVLGLALVVAGAPGPGRVGGTVSAQTLNPCALLTVDEVEPLAANSSVAEGVALSLPTSGAFACRYVWGIGISRFTLDVTVNEASAMFPGVTPDQLKQRLLASVRAGTADAVLSDVGEAAVFRPDSPVYATAFALVKGRILGVHLDGAFAPDKKDQVVGLLKSAASRL